MQPLTKPRRWTSLLALGLLLAGCGASATARTAATPTASPTLTPTPTATSVPTANPAQLATAGPCAPSSAADMAPRYAVADLVISPATFNTLSYPSTQVPDDTPLKPLDVSTLLSNGAYSAGPPTNPHMQEGGGGYVFVVCNSSTTQTHILQAVSVQIAELKPYTSQLNEWPSCAGGGPYARPYGVFQGGCGGAAHSSEYLHATFAAGDSAGATATAQQTGTGSFPGNDIAPLPYTLAPGKSIDLNVGITVSSSTLPGLYAFAFGIAADGTGPAFVPIASPVLLAPVARNWTGEACTTPAMLAQIPDTVTNPPTRYICPAS